MLRRCISLCQALRRDDAVLLNDATRDPGQLVSDLAKSVGAVDQDDARALDNPSTLGGLLALGAVGTGVAYIWNFSNVKLAGSAVASTVTYITPVVATVLGVWLLREPFRLTQLVGAAPVLLSAALVQQRWRPLRVRPVARNSNCDEVGR